MLQLPLITFTCIPNIMYVCIGTATLIQDHPSLLLESTSNEQLCRKDTGLGKRLRKWSRGHQFIVRGGGHIDSWQPLYRYVQCMLLLS